MKREGEEKRGGEEAESLGLEELVVGRREGEDGKGGGEDGEGRRALLKPVKVLVDVSGEDGEKLVQLLVLKNVFVEKILFEHLKEHLIHCWNCLREKLRGESREERVEGEERRGRRERRGRGRRGRRKRREEEERGVLSHPQKEATICLQLCQSSPHHLANKVQRVSKQFYALSKQELELFELVFFQLFIEEFFHSLYCF